MSTVIDEIKARIDLAELVGRTVALRKSGSSLKGLCPFHQEKTPSFYVFPQSGTFVCFGCGKKGTAFDWLMEREHLEFGEALRMLAQVAGVPLPARRDPEQEERTRRLYDLLTSAQAYYQGLLHGSAGMAARRYLAGREVSDTTMERFGLGYAATGNGLLAYLKSAGFSEEEAVAAGVASIADDGRHFDFFRERVLFPIRDAQGRTVAFGGRALGEGTPKYLNSRDTLLFHKHETLFGLDLARLEIAQERRAVIVEGYMDALRAHQHGFRNVVATLGTAVTERHLRTLGRLAEEIVLALDADAAGQAATWRALQVAEEGLRRGARPVVGPNRRQRQYVADVAAELKVLTLPAAKDPDELIRADPSAWAPLVQAAKPVIDFILDRLGERHDLATARGKAEAAAEVAGVLSGIANPIEQAHYIQQVAQLLQVSEAAVRRSLRGRPPTPPAAERAQRTDSADRDEVTTAGVPSAERARGRLDELDEYALALLLAWRAQGGGLSVSDPYARVVSDPTQALAGPHGEREVPGDAAEVPIPSAGEFALPQNRALHQLLLAHPEVKDLPGLRAAASDEVAAQLWRLEGRLAEVERLSQGEVREELERTTWRMRKRALVARKSQIHALLRDAEVASEQRAWEEQLSALARELGGVEERLASVGAARRRVGVR